MDLKQLIPWKRGPKAVDARQQDMDANALRLRDLSADVLAKYQEGLHREVNSPERLAAVYGTEFASAGFKGQAQNVATMAANMLRVPHAMVTIITETDQITVASNGENPMPNIRCDEGFCQNVVATGREFAVDDAKTHSLTHQLTITKEKALVSYLGVPILKQKQVIGVLCAYDDEPRHWSVADVSLLTQLTGVITRAALAATPEAGSL